MMTHPDIVTRLHQGGFFSHITERILKGLDAPSLANAEMVSRAWRECIAQGMCWKSIITQTILADALWLKTSKWVDYLSEVDEDDSHFKKEYVKMHNLLQSLDRNWCTGHFASDRLQLPELTMIYRMNGNKIVVVGQRNRNLHVWNRKTVEQEEMPSDGARDYTEVSSFDLNDNVLITASHHSRQLREHSTTITVRDVNTGKKLHTTTVPEDVIRLRFGNRLLLTQDRVTMFDENGLQLCFNIVARRLTSNWVVESPGTLIQQCRMAGSDFQLDNDFIAVLQYEEDQTCSITLLSTETLEAVHTITEQELGRCHQFHLSNGLLVSASQTTENPDSDTLIRLWDVKTGKCLRVIEEEGNKNLVNFNSRFLVSFNHGRKTMNIRNLTDALNPRSYPESLLPLRTCSFVQDWVRSCYPPFLMDDYHIVLRVSGGGGDDHLLVHDFLNTVRID